MRSKNELATVCSEPACENSVRARGLCSNHYNYLARQYRDCAVDGCASKAWSRGWCAAHYTRWRSTGDPTTPNLRSDPTRIKTDRDAFFWANVDTSGGPDACWPWQRKLTQGYGQLRGYTASGSAHSFSWALHRGDVPEGLTIDHGCHEADLDCRGGVTCPHRACCNPAHLRLVTFAENVRQGNARRRRLGTGRHRIYRSPKPCTYDDCSNKLTARGLCRMHYMRLRRHGDPSITKR